MTENKRFGRPTAVHMRTLRDRFLLEVDLEGIGTVTVSADYWRTLRLWLDDLLKRFGLAPEATWVPVGGAHQPCFRLILEAGAA